MKFSTNFIRTIALAVFVATTANAAPSLPHVELGNVAVREISPGRIVESFHPESSFETFGKDGIAHPLSPRDEFNVKDATLSFIQSRLNVDPDTIAFRTDFSHNVTHHAYVKQQVNGIPISNAVANVAFNTATDKVVSFGSSFVEPTSIPSATPSISVEDAISKAENALSGKYNDQPTTLEYVARKDGSLSLAHVVQIQNFDQGLSVEAFVDAHSGELVHLTDFAAKASYFALPIYKQSPLQLFEFINDPQQISASPWGWHSTDGQNLLTTTTGNNAIAFKNSVGNVTVQSSPTLNFNYPQNLLLPVTSPANVNAARVNAFYVVNSIHDISYLYGFTERAFNFQQANFGKGGLGNDGVRISVQDAGENNNAHFFYSADGQPGDLRLGIFTSTPDPRDSAFANDVVVHEYTHGITSRMTGGGTGQCLQLFESRGLGEGWSDALAEWTEQTSGLVLDYVTGAWITGNPGGIRHYPYSTSTGVNPLRYSDGFGRTDEHDIGEIWANMLHNVHAALINVHGFDPNARTNPNTTAGNTVWLHLFIDSLALQPCNPTFINARDAWIQADINRYNGANYCTLWRTFASRGLGVNAAPNYVNGFNVPGGC